MDFNFMLKAEQQVCLSFMNVDYNFLYELP